MSKDKQVSGQDWITETIHTINDILTVAVLVAFAVPGSRNAIAEGTDYGLSLLLFAASELAVALNTLRKMPRICRGLRAACGPYLPLEPAPRDAPSHAEAALNLSGGILGIVAPSMVLADIAACNIPVARTCAERWNPIAFLTAVGMGAAHFVFDAFVHRDWAHRLRALSWIGKELGLVVGFGMASSVLGIEDPDVAMAIGFGTAAFSRASAGIFSQVISRQQNSQKIEEVPSDDEGQTFAPKSFSKSQHNYGTIQADALPLLENQAPKRSRHCCVML